MLRDSMLVRVVAFLIAFAVSNSLDGQTDTTVSKVKFDLDYRFRAEQDWDSRRSNGTYREDRSRLRYRLRAGATYSDNGYSFGMRIRTGDPKKQQDPQLTLGKGLQEFGTLPIGFEKAFFQYEKNDLSVCLGKNTYPFDKNNELFWSDNVFPEGITFNKAFDIEKGQVNKVNLVTGHYILKSNNESFLTDAYFQGLQANLYSKKEKLKLSSALYLFRNIPNIPDGAHTYLMDYSILHLSSKVKFKSFVFDVDYYHNLNDYSDDSNVDQRFYEQKNGYTAGIQYGDIASKKSWMFKLTYAYLQRYSILDYMAQNDWARWDYSVSNSPDGRLSNLNGVEAVIAYSISEKINLVTKYYYVKQLIPLGLELETGQRIRFDINLKI